MGPPSTKRHAPRGGGGSAPSGPPKRGRPGGRGGGPGGGGAKKQRGPQGARPPRPPPVPHAEEDGDGSDGAISDEDVRFVAAHGAKLAFLLGDGLAEEGGLERKGGGRTRAPAAAGPTLAAGAPAAGPGPEADEDDDGGAAQPGATPYEAAPRARLPVADPGKEADAAARKRPRAPRLPLVGLDGRVVQLGEGGAASLGKASARAVAAAAAVQGIDVFEEEDTKGDGGGGGEEEEEEEEEEGGPEDSAPASSESEWEADEAGAGDDDDALPPPLPPPTPILPVPAASPAAPLRRGMDEPAAARDRLARLATKVLASPEARLPHLRALVAECGAPDPATGRLAMLSAAAVFRDIAPGYRIRVPEAGGGAAGARAGAAAGAAAAGARVGEDSGAAAAAAAAAVADDAALSLATDAALSKEVRALRAYEAGLLGAYQTFLRTVLAASGGKGADVLASTTVGGGESPAARARSRAAVRCLAELLVALPHFNFAGDLLRVREECRTRGRKRQREGLGRRQKKRGRGVRARLSLSLSQHMSPHPPPPYRPSSPGPPTRPPRPASPTRPGPPCMRSWRPATQREAARSRHSMPCGAGAGPPACARMRPN